MVSMVNDLNLLNLTIEDEHTGKVLRIDFTSQICGKSLEISNIKAQPLILSQYSDCSSKPPKTYTVVTTEIKKKIEEHIKIHGNLEQNNINKIIFL